MARHVETATDFADLIVVRDSDERALKHCGQNETVKAHATDDINVGECFDDGRRIGSGAAGFNRTAAPASLLLMAANTFVSSAMVALC